MHPIPGSPSTHGHSRPALVVVHGLVSTHQAASAMSRAVTAARSQGWLVEECDSEAVPDLLSDQSTRMYLLPAPCSSEDAAHTTARMVREAGSSTLIVVSDQCEGMDALLADLLPSGLLFDPGDTADDSGARQRHERQVGLVLAAAAARAGSERRFRTLIETMHDFVLELGDDGRIAYANRPFCESCGIDASTLRNRFVHELLPEEQAGSVALALHELFVERRPVRGLELHFSRAGGTPLPVLVNADPPLPEPGSPPAATTLFVAYDITERKSTEREIYLLAHALKSVREGVCITDMHDSILFTNDALNDMYGYDALELVGQNVSVLRSPDNPSSVVQEIYPATVRHGWQGELLNRRKDGSEFPVFISTSTVRDEIGRPVAMIGVASDITGRRQQEDALRRAQVEAERANQLKSEFLANMSHEIRTPLNVILGCASLIEENLTEELAGEYRGFFASINQSGRRLLDTVQKIIDISRFHIRDFPLLLEDVNVSVITRECVHALDVLARSKGVELLMDGDESDAVIRGDTYAVTHAVMNVVENAIKYTDEGTVRVSVQRNENGVSVTVEDTGIGISPEYMPFIFDEFSQEKGGYGRPYEGTGLGLALTRKFIEACGGVIDVQSHKGVGSTFTLRFPTGAAVDVALDAHSQEELARAVLAPFLRRAPGGTAASVLLVEDDSATQHFLRVILSGTCIVHSSSTTEDAMYVLGRHSINVVIVGTALGRDDGGVQFTRALRSSARWSSLPVVALSQKPDDDEHRRCIEAGCDSYVTRPFQISSFIDLVLRLARRANGPAA